jgi:DNA-binding IclR family transcriptional regulator
MTEEKQNRQLASTLLKGLNMLELLAANKELSVTEVSRLTGQSRSSCHRLLATLEAGDYIYKTDNHRYRVGLKVLELAGKISREIPIKKAAAPYLQTLAAKFRETINLGYWDGGKVIHLDKVESNEILTSDPRIGSEALGHCTALGKVCLAYLNQQALEALLDRYHFTALTPHTITSRMEFLEELKKVREQGFALDKEELSLGLKCVAAPVFDFSGQITGAISISAPAARMEESLLKKAVTSLTETCRKLSRELGAK